MENKLAQQRTSPSTVINRKLTGNSAKYVFPSDLLGQGNQLVHFAMVENTASYVGGAGSLTPGNLYVLPLPKPLSDQFPVRYDVNFDVGRELAALTRFANIPIKTIGGVAARAVGISVNTYRMVTLSQPEFRRHTLFWKLAPRSFEESQTLAKMFYAMKIGMTPRGIGAEKVGGSGLALEFPKVYTPFFAPSVKYLYKFKPCVIENLNITYDGENQTPAFYRNADNPPEGLLVQMTLIELEFWIRQDLERGRGADGLPTNFVDDIYNFANSTSITQTPGSN